MSSVTGLMSDIIASGVIFFSSFHAIHAHKRFERTLFIRTKTQSANLRGNPLCRATKRYLNKQLNGEKRWIMRWKAESLICFWLSYVVSLSSARKNSYEKESKHCVDVSQLAGDQQRHEPWHCVNELLHDHLTKPRTETRGAIVHEPFCYLVMRARGLSEHTCVCDCM